MRVALLFVVAAYKSREGSRVAVEARTEAMMEASMERRTREELTRRAAVYGVSIASPVEEHDHAWIATWLRYVTFAFLLKVGALLSSVAGTLSPIRCVWAMKDARSTLTYAPYPFLMVFGAAFQWCIYGTLAFLITNNYGFLILVYSNCFGVVMGAYYAYTYWLECRCAERLKQLKMTAAGVAFVYGMEVVAVLFASHTRALFFVGTLSATMSVLVTASPLGDLQNVLKTGDVSSIPRDVVLAGLVCSTLWLGCAVMLHDMWIMVPNFLGLILGMLQLSLLVFFDGLGLRLPLPLLSRKHRESFNYGACEEAPEPASPTHLGAAGMGCTGGDF